MAALVEHDKRRQEILTKAFDLFIEEGYEDVTFQKIADRCGITRTTLYIYFKNKREIFLWSIKQLTSRLEENLLAIIKDTSINSVETLKLIFISILDECEHNERLFKILLIYLIQLQKSGDEPSERINRRVIKLQHFLTTVIIRGQRLGELKKLPIKEINDMLYSLMESAIFRLSVLNKNTLEDNRRIINFAIEGLKVNS